jgi:hypothetical protein
MYTCTCPCLRTICHATMFCSGLYLAFSCTKHSLVSPSCYVAVFFTLPFFLCILLYYIIHIPSDLPWVSILWLL